jgi:hypothetical protein
MTMSTTTVGAKESAAHGRRSLEEVRERILSYENEIKDYLDNLNANVEYYKFSVEKHGDGVTVEVSVKATIRPKHTEATA